MAKSSKYQAPNTVEYEVNTIVRFDMDIRADTCCADKNWRLLSKTGQLFDIKVFHNSYQSIANVPVGRTSTAVLHDDGTVYILIRNESLLFGKSMDHSLIN